MIITKGQGHRRRAGRSLFGPGSRDAWFQRRNGRPAAKTDVLSNIPSSTSRNLFGRTQSCGCLHSMELCCSSGCARRRIVVGQIVTCSSYPSRLRVHLLDEDLVAGKGMLRGCGIFLLMPQRSSRPHLGLARLDVARANRAREAANYTQKQTSTFCLALFRLVDAGKIALRHGHTMIPIAARPAIDASHSGKVFLRQLKLFLADCGQLRGVQIWTVIEGIHQQFLLSLCADLAVEGRSYCFEWIAPVPPQALLSLRDDRAESDQADSFIDRGLSFSVECVLSASLGASGYTNLDESLSPAIDSSHPHGI